MSKRTTILALILAGFMSLGLFMISYQVQDLEDQLDAPNRDISRDSRAVHVLQAEWAHLNDPQRLRMLSERYLGLEPIGTKQLGTVEEIPWRPMVEAAEKSEVAEAPSPKSAPAMSAPAPMPVPAPTVAQPTQAATERTVEDALPAIRRALGLTPTPLKEATR